MSNAENAENVLKEKFEIWQKSMGHCPIRVSAKDMDYQTSTIQAQWEGWKAGTDALHEAYCDDLAFQRERLEKGYYEQVQTLNQRYAAIEKENVHLLKLIMEKNNLDPIPKPMPIYPNDENLYKISYRYTEAHTDKFAPEILECVARALWDYEHDNRSNEILDVEWNLLRSDYLCRAQIVLTTYNDIGGR